MTTTEANEFFAARTEERVGADPEDKHPGDHRSSFKAKPSTAQARKKSRGTVRLVIQYHFDIPTDDLKAFEKAHGRQYPDGVDYGRALLEWITAEGKVPNTAILEEASERITWEVAK